MRHLTSVQNNNARSDCVCPERHFRCATGDLIDLCLPLPLSLFLFLPLPLPPLTHALWQDREAAVLMWKTSVPATSDCCSISALPAIATATATATCASFVCYLCVLLSLSLCVCVDKGCACRSSSSRCRLQNMNMHEAEEGAGAGAEAQPVPGRQGGKRERGVTVRTINKFARCRVAKQLLLLPCGSWRSRRVGRRGKERRV